jgi:predicted DNA-binding protein (UPF0251 family)
LESPFPHRHSTTTHFEHQQLHQFEPKKYDFFARMTVADEAIDQAIESVNSGVPQKEAAKQWGVPPTTLWNRLHGTRADKEVKKAKQRLTEVQEAIIVDWAKSEERAGQGRSKVRLRAFGQAILMETGDMKPLGAR